MQEPSQLADLADALHMAGYRTVAIDCDGLVELLLEHVETGDALTATISSSVNTVLLRVEIGLDYRLLRPDEVAFESGPEDCWPADN